MAGLGILFEGYDQGVMSGVNISPSYIVRDSLSPCQPALRHLLTAGKDLMKIGDGASGTITRPSKQGGLVAIYYLGTLVGALMYGFRISVLDLSESSDSFAL